ncbi:MAG: phosphoribosylamine--glycine ligase, partial [Cyanobacteriota bacterium]
MKVFLIGSGGRENAIAWKISQSEKLTKLYCAPSNPGIDKYATRVNIDVTNIEELCKFALDKMIDLTIVGPELPLSLGIVDLFESKGLKIFGPSKVAAQIETSKCFTKELLSKYNIPTPEYKIIKSYEESIKYIDNSKFPLVVKDDALAAGKGVTVCFHYDQAANALK